MLFVAEIGSNHKGIPALAHEMIRQSKLAGADIAKFQLGRPADDPIRGVDVHAPLLKSWCDQYEIEFMASIWSAGAIDLAESLGMKRYKIAHQMDDCTIVARIWNSGKEVFHSARANGTLHQNVRGIYCTPDYPQYDLSMPDAFGEMPELYYGYSSHMHGMEDALIAIARGACYIEKHVTLDKTEESIRDNHFALSFDEFSEMVKIGRGMHRLCGSS